MTVDILDLVVTTMLAICMGFLVYRYFKTTQMYQKIIDDYEKKIENLYALIDILGNGSCNPMVREIYFRLRGMNPEKALETLKNKGEFFRKITSEGYIKAREQMEEIIEKTDSPETKRRFESAIEEMDGMFNLLGSIDKDSAPEHVKQIMDNVAASIGKLRDNGIDISIEGIE